MGQRYYFHLSDGSRVEPDAVGAALPDPEAAVGFAAQAALSVMEAADGRDWAGWYIDVADETGARLTLVPFPALR